MSFDLEIPEEFEEYKETMVPGAKKHGANNWLEADGNKSSFKQMHYSMLHHLAESFLQPPTRVSVRADKESKLDPLKHLTTRSNMTYTRIKRGIVHKEDAAVFGPYDLIDELERFLREQGYLENGEGL